MKKVSLFLFTFLIIAQSTAFAIINRNEDNHERLHLAYLRGKEGHGGYGVYLRDPFSSEEKLFLLDLVENGIELDPFFDEDIEVNKEYFSDLNFALSDLELSKIEMDLLARKLSEIEKVSPILAFTYLAAIKLYTWKLINRDLVNSPDFSSVIRVDNRKLVQIAIRKEQYVRINESLWKELDAANKVALIFHEITYAFISVEKDEVLSESLNPSSLVAHSAKARDITGYLFSTEFKRKGINGFNLINNNTIPYVFTDEKVNISHHTFTGGYINGFSLEKGILKIVVSPLPPGNGFPYGVFEINQASSTQKLYEKISNEISDYCTRLQEHFNTPPLIQTIKIERKKDRLREVFVMFERGLFGSNLTIKEKKLKSDEKEIDTAEFEATLEGCQNVLIKHIYHSNRTYIPVALFQ